MGESVCLSVLVCTYNRALSLRKTLDSVAVQDIAPSVGWEIVVVDNNSTDGTRQVVEECGRQSAGRIRYVLEPQQGVSHARNTAVREARGEIVAFIDDDETASVDWLRNLTAHLDSEEWIGAGGPIAPQWERPRPKWTEAGSSFTAGPLVSFTYTPDPQAPDLLTTPPFSANLAIRKKIFEKFGGFRTDLGRVGDLLLSNEDTELGRRLMAAGLRLRWEPTALVYHEVSEDRLRKSYFLSWWFAKGRSDVREVGVLHRGCRVFGIPLLLFSDIAKEVVRWVITLDPGKRFICRLKIWAYAGQAYECRDRSAAAKRNALVANAAGGESKNSNW
jgi:GT2 family glycosyltransferase